ncbi:PepSY-associated TM helix domain-containing protein [Stutzerimonas kirkiae]|uniref:PepSY-associated TM helix domain-containing protein n=1 Tax=Stutzerimonas kirkiae TaxID=2211392 RepID=UPI0010385632|nr:PepSY-associated TM helix domain-containing protein [Stutzerimonas kirkiae]TBV08731.1 PepSY domain-containing protein [Stutzerimonas kirkiae]TBV11485.1 PepSY domain-containing protein [Stutzerimonas kirkiae]
MKPKSKTITQSLSWLHTWSGLIFGWLLFAIFLTGTLAVFDREIDGWMRPEIPAHSLDQVEAAQVAIDYLQTHHGDATAWNIGLPTERSPSLTVSAGEQRRGGGQQLDPHSGEPLDVRETAGGNFFFRFHYTLNLPRNIGIWVVGLAAMAMLVALISGIVIHKKFFKEFFTFRPAKGQRSWLDAHNATGVLVLPFHLMITYTGLVIFYLVYMPAAVDALFDGNRDEGFGRGGNRGGAQQVAQQERPRGAADQPGENAERGFNRGGPSVADTGRASSQGVPPGEQGARGFSRPEQSAERGERGSNRAGQSAGQLDSAMPSERVPLTALGPLLAEAERLMGEVSGLSIQNPGRSDARIEARPVLGNIIELTKGRSMQFDGVSGVVLRQPAESNASQLTQKVMAGLHFAQFGGYPMRWLYFLCSLASCAMIATGVVLFTVKRRRRHDAEGAVGALLYHAAERLNVAVVAGLALACVSLLWANRLLPVELELRGNWEVRVFFLVWLATLGHAIVRPWLKAWREQLVLAALLCLALPLLNLLVENRGEHAWLEVTSVGIGLLLGWTGWKLGQPPKERPPRRAGKALAEAV